jgi:hypothetical protein
MHFVCLKGLKNISCYKTVTDNAWFTCETGDRQQGAELWNTKAEESTTLEAFTRQPVKTQKTEKILLDALMKYGVCELAATL